MFKHLTSAAVLDPFWLLIEEVCRIRVGETGSLGNVCRAARFRLGLSDAGMGWDGRGRVRIGELQTSIKELIGHCNFTGERREGELFDLNSTLHFGSRSKSVAEGGVQQKKPRLLT